MHNGSMEYVVEHLMNLTKLSCCLLKALLMCVLLLPLTEASAQDNRISFNQLTVENGLSQSSVLSITQDHTGLMWFGTKDGLNKYNSRNFEIYKYNKNDNASLSSGQNINALLTDRRGNVWVGTQKGLNLYLPESNSFKRFTHNPKDKNSLSNDIIRCIYEDKQGHIWIGTDSGLNKFSGNRFERFFTSTDPGKGPVHHLIKAIYQDHNKVLWLGTSQGLTAMTSEKGKYHFKTYIHESTDAESLSDNDISSILEDGKHNLWVGTHNGGLELLDRGKGRFRHFRAGKGQGNSISSNVIRKLLLARDGKLWIATLNGINILDVENQKIRVLNHNPEDPSSLNQNSIYDIFQDAAGSMWVGTYYGGVNVYHVNSTPFKAYKANGNKNGLSSNVVSAIVEDGRHNLWIGTEAEGLNYYDRVSGKFSSFRHDPENQASLGSNLVKAVSIDPRNGKVWVGTYEGGLDLFLPGSQSFKHYKPNPDDADGLHSSRIVALLHDSQQRFWVGTRSQGIFLYNEKSDNFKLFNAGKYQQDLKFIRYIFEDAKRNIWMASNSGTYILSSDGKTIKALKAGNSENLFNDINFIQEDSHGQIWLGGYTSGLICYSPDRNTARFYSKKDGLPSNVVLGMLEDKSGHLWISTDNGLSKLDGEVFKNYTVRDGLPGNVFNYNSFLKDSQGVFFFGGFNGLLSFLPDQIQDNNIIPKVVFTGLKLFSQPVGMNDETRLLHKNISLTETLTFSAQQNVFTVDFAVLNYIKSEKNRYAYKLEGFEENWNEVSNSSATFTNLPSGTYTLLVKGANNDGLWSAKPERLIIHIKPPLWKTWWAFLIYVICFLGLLFLVFRFLWIRALLKREHELYQMKLDFFTNVSHEIRTPLTLIVGPLEQLIHEAEASPVLYEKLLGVRKNADRLTRLVTELLDFRKTESGKLQLNVSSGNVVGFAKEIYNAFQYLAVKQQIDYQFITEEEEITLYFDPEQLEKVLFNLLSNAFKFTPDQGTIRLSVAKGKYGMVEISIADNGVGIAGQSRDKLFSDFYQVKDALSRNGGTGIGLALSRRIAKLHHGDLLLADEGVVDGLHTCFILKLKTGTVHFSKDELKEAMFNSTDSYHDLQTKAAFIPAAGYVPVEEESQFLAPVLQEEQPYLLIVEDNNELRDFMLQSLRPYYQVLEADNGASGLELALEKIPDLIISDVMMPVMDGLEFCQLLKADQRTSHIPVILLTARSGNTHELNGLKTGAEAYVTKPFSMESLKLNIANLLTLQANMRKKFSQQLSLQPSNVLIESVDEAFLHKIMTIIENHFTTDDFNVNTLAAELGMSTPILYKKIKALTGLTVNNFIKSMRLKRAAQLLVQKTYTISEIAYMVGFNDPKYFSKEFVKQFGQTPSDYLPKP